jgi:hypothetical protein
LRGEAGAILGAPVPSEAALTPQILTTLATGPDERAAVAQTMQQLAGFEGRVRGGLLFVAGDLAAGALRIELAHALPQVPFLGTNGARVLATEMGAAEGRGLAGLWLVGEGFGFAAACAGGTAAGSRALDEALQRGGLKPFKVRLAVAHVAGAEGSHIELLGERLGRVRSVLGAAGTAIFTHDQLVEDGVGVALCDWPWQLGCAIDTAFAPTASRGRVTRADSGVIGALDGQDALGRYAGWVGEPPDRLDLRAFAETHPLGLVRGSRAGQPVIAPARPCRAADGRGLAVQADVREGDEVVLLSAPADALSGQPARAVERARTNAGFSQESLRGALVLADLPATVDRAAASRALSAAMGRRPFLLVFGSSQVGAVVPRRLEQFDLAAGALALSDEEDLSEGA